MSDMIWLGNMIIPRWLALALLFASTIAFIAISTAINALGRRLFRKSLGAGAKR